MKLASCLALAVAVLIVGSCYLAEFERLMAWWETAFIASSLVLVATALGIAGWWWQEMQ